MLTKVCRMLFSLFSSFFTKCKILFATPLYYGTTGSIVMRGRGERGKNFFGTTLRSATLRSNSA